METKFETFKKEIISRAKVANARKSEFTRALNSENFEQLTKVITDNFNYCCKNDIITASLIEPLNEILQPLGLCANIKEATNCFVILTGSSHANLYGNSHAELFDSSHANLFNNSYAKLYDSSTAKLYDSSTAKLYDSSYICSFNTIEHKINDSAICRYYFENKIKLSKNIKIETF